MARVGHVEKMRFEQDGKEAKEFAYWLCGRRAFQDNERSRVKSEGRRVPSMYKKPHAYLAEPLCSQVS